MDVNKINKDNLSYVFNIKHSSNNLSQEINYSIDLITKNLIQKDGVDDKFDIKISSCKELKDIFLDKNLFSGEIDDIKTKNKRNKKY